MKLDAYKFDPWVLISVGIVVTVQLVALLVLEPVQPFDSKEYLSISGSLFAGKGYGVLGSDFQGPEFSRFVSFKGENPTRMRQPMYPLFLVLFYWLPEESILVLQVSQIVLNTLTFCLMLLIAGRAFGEHSWGGTFLALALYFPLWMSAAVVMTETLFCFLLVLAMFFLQRAISQGEHPRYFVASGACFALAFLTRPIGLPVFLFGLFPILLRAKVPRALMSWSVLSISFLIVTSPWFVRNAIVLDDYTALSTDGGFNLWRASTSANDPLWWDSAEFNSAIGNGGYYLDRTADKRFKEMALRHLEADPLACLKRGVLRVAETWSYFCGSRRFVDDSILFGLFRLLQFAILAFAVLGLFVLDRANAVYFLVPIVALSSVLLFTMSTSRFILPAMPFVLVLSGQGLCLALRKLGMLQRARTC